MSLARQFIIEQFRANLKVFLASNQIKEAIEHCNAFIKQDPCPEAYLERGKIYFEQGSFQQALDDFRQATLKSADDKKLNSECYVFRGRAYDRLKLIENSISDYAKAATINDNNWEAFYYCGMAYA